MKKIYDIEFLKNFETREFSIGYLILTNTRIILKPLYKNYIIKENISDIFCLMVNYDQENQNPYEMLLKINRSDHTLEVVIKSKLKILKIIKKISKYFDYNTQNKIKVYKSAFGEFTNETCIDYLNLCYDVIQTFRRPVRERLRLEDFKKVEVLGEGSNGKVSKKNSKLIILI